LIDGEIAVEEYVSTGGAELPALILANFEARARRAESESGAQAIRAEGEALAARVQTAVRSAFTEAIQRIYWLTAILVAIGGVMAMRIPELPLRTTHDRAVATAESSGS
jgi:hypothetical protein